MGSDRTRDALFASLDQVSDNPDRERRRGNPVHVFYGGAHLFAADTPEKLARIALGAQRQYAPDFITFAKAMWLPGADSLPDHPETSLDLIELITEDPAKAEDRFPGSAFCLEVFRRTVRMLEGRPVSDFRIDFEDGYGFRTDEEEDAHALSASNALAVACNGLAAWNRTLFGFRIKSFQRETRERSVRTLHLFISNLFEKCGGVLPEDLVVTLPKVRSAEEIEVLAGLLEDLEQSDSETDWKIGIEAMVETPEAVSQIRSIAEAAPDRLLSAHFGAYDYTSALGISSGHQHIGHKACDFARMAMLNAFAPQGIAVVDSVTTEMPVPLRREPDLAEEQKIENRNAVHRAWRTHFNSVTKSMINGFYRSWDLHPAQLVPRYAAVYAFFLEERQSQIARLRAFVDKASRAVLTGNTFDDAASAEGILNFFRRGISCEAFDADAIAAESGLDVKYVRSGSFAEIMAERMDR